MTIKHTPATTTARKAKAIGFSLVASPDSKRYRFKMATGQLVENGKMSIRFTVFGRNTRKLDYVFINIDNKDKKSYSYNSFMRGKDSFQAIENKLSIGIGKYKILFEREADFFKIAKVLWDNGFVSKITPGNKKLIKIPVRKTKSVGVTKKAAPRSSKRAFSKK